MISSRLARRAVLLASAAFITATPVFAADFSVPAGATDPAGKTMTGADKGVVEATGTLTASGSQTINLSNANDTDVAITNSGVIQNTGAGNRAIDSSNSNGVQRTITINNKAGATIQASDDAVRLRGAASGGVVTVNNDGTIKSQLSGQGIDFDGLTGAVVTINNNAGALIQGADQDGVRPGNGGTVNNAGTIQSTIATVYGSYDGVDFQSGGGTVNNTATGVITGVRHGITGGDASGGVATSSLTVTNDGTITGQNGSGVGSDGGGSVTNHGTIIGAISNLSPDGDGDGVDIDYAGTVDNYGAIKGMGAVGVDSGGHPNGSEGVAMGGGSITNHTGALISGANSGILVDDGALGPALAQTTTQIDNDGTIEGLGGNAVTIVGPYGDTINNTSHGLISGSITGIQLINSQAGAAQGAAAITNDGIIQGLDNNGDGILLTGPFGAVITNNATGVIKGGASGIVYTNTTGGAAAGTVTINNAGTVTSTKKGPAISLAGPLTGSLTNSGTISSVNGRGVDFDVTGLAGAFHISNSGTIQTTDDAVRLQGTGAGAVITVDNSGTIKTSKGGQALDFDNLAGATIVINNTATGVLQSTDADGIRPGEGAVVNNAGLIQATIGTAYDNNDGVDWQGHSGVVNNASTGQIIGVRHGITSDVDVNVVNDGKITGQNGSGIGSDGTGTVVNHGTITGAISGQSPNGDGDGVDIDLAGTIDNYGTIQGTGAVGVDSGGHPNGSEGIAMGGGTITNHAGAVISGANSGILVDDGALGAAPAGATTITNAGTIQGLNGNGITLVGAFNDTITNSGVISASTGNRAIDFGDGDDTLNLSTGSTITGLVDGGAGSDTLNLSGTGTQGPVANFETLNVLAGANWSLTGAQSFATANIASGGRLSGLSNVGDLTVNGVIAPGNSIGTTAVSGNLTFGATGVYEAEVNAAGAHDLITVGGTATLAGQVSVLAAPGAYNTTTTYTLLTAGALSGTFNSVTTDMVFLDPQLSYSGGNVILTLQRNDVLFSSIAQTPNQVAVANAITGAGFSAGVYQTLVSQSAAQARTSFDVLSGDLHATVRGAVLEDSRHASGFAFDRLDAEESGAWGQVYFTTANTTATNGQAADSEGVSGFAAGFDAQAAGWRVGIQGGLGDDSVNQKDRFASAQLEESNIGLYAGRSFGNFKLKAGADAGRHNVETTRNVAASGLNQILAAHYDINTYQYYGEAAFDANLNGLKIEPFANVVRQHLSAGHFTETGGDAALSGVGPSTNVTYGTAGVRLNGTMDWAGTTLTPRASFGVRYGGNVQEATAASLQFATGPVFTVDGAARDRTAGVVELGLEGKLAGKGRVSIVYSGVFSEHYTDSSGRIAWSWGF